MASIADFFINIGADIGDFQKEMADMKKTMQGVGDDLKNVGGTLTKGVTAPLAAIGTAAFMAANEFDKASKNIRAGTGATGDDLEALNKSFKNVFATFPGDADTVSNALADINTRTGLTGKPLENLSKQFLELSKITGEDVSTSIADMTRLFGSWGIAAEDGGGAMDYLWKTSQTFGIGVGDLQSKLTEMGPTFQALGYSMEESAALLGHWEREGVNTGTMLTGLKKGLQNLSAAGKDPAKELPGIVDTIKNMGDEGDATALAMEVFGNKAGPEMARAIRDGKFEVEELLGILEASDETIGKAAADTMTLGEQFTMLKNNTMLALEPIGKVLLDLAQNYLPPLLEKVQGLAEWFQNLSPQIATAIVVVGGIAAAIGPLLVVAGTLISSLSSLAPLFTAVKLAIAAATVPIGPIIAAVAALIAIGVLLYKNWDDVKAYAVQAWGAIKDFINPLVEKIRQFVTQTFEKLLAFWQENGEKIKQAGQNIWDFIEKIITTVLKSIMAVMEFIWPAVEFLIVGTWEAIKNVINGAINIILGIIQTFASLFTGDWSGLWEGIKQIISGALELIWGWVQLFGVGRLLKFFGTLVGDVAKVFTTMWTNVKTIFKSGLDDVFNNVKSIFDNVLSFITGLGTSFFNAGKGLIDQMIKGIKAMASKVVDTVKDIAGNIRDLLPFSPAKEGPLSDLDKLDFGGPIGDSIEKALPYIHGMMSDLVTMPGINVGDGNFNNNGGGTPVVITLDGREIARTTLPHMVDTIRTNTGLTW